MSTPLDEIPGVVAQLRESFKSGLTRPLAFRKQQLLRLQAMVNENLEAWHEAMTADLGRPHFENSATAINDIVVQLRFALETFEEKTKPRKAQTPALFLSYGRWEIVPEPYGVVLIISPWNYPLPLTINPLIGALCAGNTVLIKPSEVSSNMAALMQKLMHKYLDPRAVRVVLGGVPETTKVLEQRFDKICYTGGGAVAKVVAAAAAKHLTPMLLELGGKTPTYVHKSANLEVTVRRICGAKFVNCGQTCIAPDHVLVDKAILGNFIDALKAQIAHSYGGDAATSSSYARVVTVRHAERIKALLDEDHGGEVILGGETDTAAKYIAPTLILNPRDDSKLMTEEIFGPVLPIITVNGIDEAIERANVEETPLAAYMFGEDKAVQDAWVERVPAGGTCINDAMGQYINPHCPFGGKGPSGMGMYRGAWSFDAFSHLKTVARSYTSMDWMLSSRYPPYTAETEEKLRSIMTVDADAWLRRATPVVVVALAAAVIRLLLAFVEIRVSLR